VIWPSQLHRKGLITKAEKRMLNKIYKFNALLFDFCLKRSADRAESTEDMSVDVRIETWILTVPLVLSRPCTAFRSVVCARVRVRASSTAAF
jgi:hypothetical protein